MSVSLDIPVSVISEMWEVIDKTEKFPDDYVKAIEWGIKTMCDRKSNPNQNETILNLMIGNLAGHRAERYQRPGVDMTFFRMLSRVEILTAWCVSIARAKSRDERRKTWDRRGWRQTAFFRIPQVLAMSWRQALGYKSPLLFPPAYLKDEKAIV